MSLYVFVFFPFTMGERELKKECSKEGKGEERKRDNTIESFCVAFILSLKNDANSSKNFLSPALSFRL